MALLNLWPSEATWRQRSGSTLAQPLPGPTLTYHQ